MRIALTALTPRGPQDLLVSADDAAVVGQVAAVLREVAGETERLAPVIALPRTQAPAGHGPAPPLAAGQQAPRRAGGPELPRRAAAQQTLWLDGRPVDPRARAGA